MTQQKLTGAALLAEVEKSLTENPKIAADKLAVRCGYTKITRSRSGEERVKPQLESYYEAFLLAKGESFGITVPETQKTSSRSATTSYKVLKKTGAGVVPRRFMELLGCQPDDFFFIEEGEDGTLLLRKDVEKSEQARIEAANNPLTAETSLVAGSESEEDEDEDEDDNEDGDEEEEVAVQQPAIPGGVSSTTVRIPQSVS